MTSAVIISVCILLLLAYAFDISASLTKIPSVILLLIAGWLVKEMTKLSAFTMPNLSPLLPILGTIGLILIVLDGSLELEINASKKEIIKKTTFTAFISLIILSILLAFVFAFGFGIPFKVALVNAIPFCVMSSSVAIPSARTFSASQKEFIIYESSLSDIFGVLLFNFVSLNEVITPQSFIHFGIDTVVIIAISFAAVIGLSFLLARISHSISYTPIIVLVILVYALSKEFHLPSLVVILVFGIFLGNLDDFKNFYWIKRLRTEKLEKEVLRFKDFTTEATFLVRSLFFILFGFLIEVDEVLELSSLPWSVGIVAMIIFTRWAILKWSGMYSRQLLWIVPRGLITVLLFLAIPARDSILGVNRSMVLQVVLLSVVIMMVGTMTGNRSEKEAQSQATDLESNNTNVSNS